MRRSRYVEPAEPAGAAFKATNLDDLRPLAKLITDEPPRLKVDLVPVVAAAMTDPKRLRALYERLDPLSQNAVRVAASDPDGRLDRHRFRAWFGDDPRFDTADPNRPMSDYSYAERRKIKPTLLRLFFPRYDRLPADTREILLRFVPPPEPFVIPTREAPPETYPRQQFSWTGDKRVPDEWQEPVRVRETAGEAEADLRAVLRLVDLGKVRVTDKKRVPTEAAREAVSRGLAGGDFYAPDDAEESSYDPAHDLAVKAFAWPALLQAGGLAEPAGGVLRLTANGKRALTAPAPEVLRKLWRAWLKTRLFDEFARVEAIKGQGRAQMSAAAGRRAVVTEALAACPPGRWFAVDDFFRLLRATGREFAVANSPYHLYIADQYYGNLAYADEGFWEVVQGRFVLAFLFEYAATLGLVDLAFVEPQSTRTDFHGMWGTDELSCLSRYDGLLYVRVNPLGAWVLGQADEYRPVARPRTDTLRVLANMDVVSSGPLPAGDRLVLERFAEPASESVWKLSADKVRGVLEEGGSVDELEQFLTDRSADGLPATVATFLADLRAKAGRLTDAGPARLIACADERIAAELAADRQLKGICLRAGDRFVVVREGDLSAVRKAVRRLGYVWPVVSG